MTSDLLGLSDWLLSFGVTHVAMESTGEYWKPIFNILEENFDVLLVNARQYQASAGTQDGRHGCRMDCGSAEAWFAERQLYSARWTTRTARIDARPHQFVRERATLVNRLQKTLESANIKLASVASNVMGVSGRAMLEALINGTTSSVEMAELAKGRLREKRQQLDKALERACQAASSFCLV